MGNLNFKGKNIYVGIDVHKRSWSIKILSDNANLRQEYFRDPSPEMLVRYLNIKYPQAKYKCAYEAGFCGFWIQEGLSSLGVETIVIHPADIPTTDKEKRFKDDKLDAIKIAKCLRAGQLTGIHVPSAQQRADRSFVRLRYKLASDIRKTMNRITGHLDFEGQVIIDPKKADKPFDRWPNRRITLLEKKAEEDCDYTLKFCLSDLRRQRQQMLLILRRLREMSTSDRYCKLFKLLTSVPGVSLLTAMVWITEVGDASRFRHEDQLYSYLGLVPGSRSSGDSERIGKITKRGNKRLRTALVQSAWVAIGIDSTMTLAYEDYRPRMGAQKAIIRVTKKLAAILRSVAIKQTPYTPKIG